jgi:hypothetical protein
MMKLWKNNRLDAEWELDNKEIAKRFLESSYNNSENYNLVRGLVEFISDKDGLSSSWEWDKKKGSVEGNKDMLEILDIIEKVRV